MPKYNTSFDANWCNKYSWVKPSTTDETAAFCKLCNSEISVANRGEGALKQHQGTKKHETAANAAGKSIPLSLAFKSMCFIFIVSKSICINEFVNFRFIC